MCAFWLILLCYVVIFLLVYWLFDLPVNMQGLRFREWWRERPRWRGDDE